MSSILSKIQTIFRSKAQTPICFREAFRQIALHIRRYPINFILSIVLALWIQTELFGWGSLDFTAATTGRDPVSSVSSFFLMTFMLMRLSHGGRWKWFMAVIAVALGALAPLWSMTGAPLVSGQNMDTLMATDIEESLEFLSTIPWRDWDIGFALALAFCTFIPRTRKANSVSTPVMAVWKRSSLLCLILVPALTPMIDIASGYARFTYLSYATPPSTWHITGKIPEASRVKNYVIVMSESLSEKTMGLYGAPFETTPFMSNIPTKRIETMVSPSMATVAAVSLFTSRYDEADPLHPHYEDNIISLAKEAGLKTYWISSQGRMSSYEARISYIASNADVQYFVSKHNDLGLLPVIENIVKTPEPDGRSRLIFVHTYGAHEETCSRVEDIGRPFKTGAEEFLDCYLAAAYKADLTVEGIVKAIQKAGESYSLIFTSDHAINFRRDDDGELIARRNSKYKGQFEVPFVQMGEGIDKTVVSKITRSSISFRDYFPTWIGVHTNQTPDDFDIFDAPSTREEDIFVLKGDDDKKCYCALKHTVSMKEIIKSVPN